VITAGRATIDNYAMEKMVVTTSYSPEQGVTAKDGTRRENKATLGKTCVRSSLTQPFPSLQRPSATNARFCGVLLFIGNFQSSIPCECAEFWEYYIHKSKLRFESHK
jgi:hypothetical protein